MTQHDFTTRPAIAAERYAARDWPVLPVHSPTPAGCSCGHSDCTNHAKHPRIRQGAHRASTRAAQVASWWRRWPDANVAIATGALVVVDIDGDRGAQSLDDLETRHHRLPETAWVSTARGRHLYFHAGLLEVRNSAGRLGPGIDVRGHGGYAIAPPSRHPSGDVYTWHELERGVAPLPLWLAELHTPMTSASVVVVRDQHQDHYIAAAVDGELRRVATAPPHTRNNALNHAAFRLGQLAGAGLVSIDDLDGPLLEAALSVGQGEREARATIASGLLAGERNPRRRSVRSR